METTKKDNSEKKKGFFAALLESMVKTGGCCGSGESCGCKPTPTKNQQDENQKDDQNESGKN